MPEPSQVSVERIEHAILMVKGYRVMLDADLAVLYEVKTKALNQASVEISGDFRGVSCSSLPRRRLSV